MPSNGEAALPPALIAQEAQLQRLPARPPGRDAELAREVARLNDAIHDCMRLISFDDQPGDFLALLVNLREQDGS
ncbi:MAG: hypothetical protein AB7G13_17540 [Lautropia sp.]